VTTPSIEIRPADPEAARHDLTVILAGLSTTELVHVVFIGTKPDIIKQYPLYHELRRRGQQTLLCHTGQHTDPAYSGGMLKEFDMQVDVLMVMDGSGRLGASVSSMVTCADLLFSTAAETGHTLVPYTHGDTATSMAVSVAAYANKVACCHVEAGIRTVTPTREFLLRQHGAFEAGEFDWDDYLAAHRRPETFVTGSREPFPEQFNTRVSDAGTGVHAAPVELDRTFLLEEGFPADSIVVVGNTVVDAINERLEKVPESRILEEHPQLASGRFIRVCIHRRENTHDRVRFTTYFEALEALLRQGHSILWVRLRGTNWALDHWGLESRLQELEAEFPETLLVTQVWENYTDVIASFLRYGLLATDSGSMQEEANILGVPCVTLRFGTDRGESLLAGGNVLAPPLSTGFVVEVVDAAFRNRTQLKGEQIYGERVAGKIVDEVLVRARVGAGLFRTEEDLLRLPGATSDWPGGAAGRPLTRHQR
jgi:UDP-N-acetylglucosamine 2-epimerase (non-hydrolysing)